MAFELTVKYLHFVFLFLIVGSLFLELALVKPQLERAAIKRLSIIDNIYGIGSIGILAAGFTLWFAVGKPAAFYTKNWIFHAKIGVFAVVGILSIIPTVFFAKNKKGNQEELVEVPKKIRTLIKLEILLLFIIPLLAVLMAKGVGL